MIDNPLLDFTGLPAFSKIKPEHVEPAIDTLLAENRAQLQTLLAQPEPYTWDGFVAPLYGMDERLSRAWSAVRHLNSVVNSPALREAYNACLPKLSDYRTEVSHNVALFNAYTTLAQDPEYARLDSVQQKLIQDTLRDFHLSGVGLPVAEKARYKAIVQELSKLEAQFEENVLDATQSWHLHLEQASALQGLPPSALGLLAQNAKRSAKEGYLVNLEFPSFYAVMTYADDRSLREQVYRAYVTRASEIGEHEAKLDNSHIMTQILALRHEQAQLLGYSDYASLSLATKMATTTLEVFDFIRDLAQRSREVALNDLDTLKRFARENLGLETLAAWDMAYSSEKLRQHTFSLSQEMLRPYFPVPGVLKGLFTLVQRLFSVEIVEVDAPDRWHPEVSFYELRDLDGTPRAAFYLDLYARANKRGGAWMDVCRDRRRDGATVQLPVAFMTCNGTPPVDGETALFTHDEVLTLLHEFGHGLHHMLTRVDYPPLAGINGVEWDAVELPSQFMEHWCWERESLAFLASHHETGDPLPDELFDKLWATRHFQAGMQMLRQLEFSLFDMRLHAANFASDMDIQGLLDAVRDEIAVIKPPKYNRFQHSFGHIFAGGYAAGYYSYKWAEVLSADAFARFEEEGLFNSQVGVEFREKILERGGSAPALKLFQAFRGRSPTPDALLRHYGLNR